MTDGSGKENKKLCVSYVLPPHLLLEEKGIEKVDSIFIGGPA